MSTVVESVSGIPVVDFSAMSVEHEVRPNSNNEDVQELSKQIHEAFSTIGFVYLINHGIHQEQVDSVFNVADEFFNLSPEVKAKSSKKVGTSRNGWDALERESTNQDRPGDLKESFDVGAIKESEVPWPDEHLPLFKPVVTTLYYQAVELAMRVLNVMAIGLGLDADAFAYAFRNFGKNDGGVQLRINYYPAISGNIKIKPNQLRCGEHTDYGAITLLFQDDIGGLQVRNLEGNFVHAVPIKGSILVNIADLMQRWSSDRLKSTEHRVLFPEEEKLHHPRRSIAFFFRPDSSALIKCLDGSDKYPPINSGKYISEKLSNSYQY